MQETPQQYIQRILGQLGGKDPLKIQAATPAKLSRLVRRASPAKLRKRPAPGKWSVAEILTHLADCEIVAGWRMRHILGSPGTPIQAFDQDAWAAAGHYEKRDAEKVARTISNLARRQSRVAEESYTGTMEAVRHACRAGRGDHQADYLLDGRARSQSPGTSGAVGRGEEEIEPRLRERRSEREQNERTAGHRSRSHRIWRGI